MWIQLMLKARKKKEKNTRHVVTICQKVSFENRALKMCFELTKFVVVSFVKTLKRTWQSLKGQHIALI